MNCVDMNARTNRQLSGVKLLTCRSITALPQTLVRGFVNVTGKRPLRGTDLQYVVLQGGGGSAGYTDLEYVVLRGGGARGAQTAGALQGAVVGQQGLRGAVLDAGLLCLLPRVLARLPDLHHLLQLRVRDLRRRQHQL